MRRIKSKSLSPLLSAVILLALTVSIAFVASSSISSLTQRQTETSTKYSARCLGGNLEISRVFYEKLPWYNSSWEYRKPILIQNQAGDLADYQVRIEINLSQEYQQGRIQQYCNDTRFTYLNQASNQEQEIPYWIEQCNLSANDTAIFWVKIPFLANDTNTTVYMYYGNPYASSESKMWNNITHLGIYGGVFDYNISEMQRYTGRIISIAGGWEHTCILKSNGNVICYGDNGNGRANNYTGGDAVEVSTLYLHTCILKSNGNVICYGDNGSGQANNYTEGDAKNPFRKYATLEPAASIGKEQNYATAQKLSLILKNNFNVNLTSLTALIKTDKGNYYKQEINLTSNPLTPGSLRAIEINLTSLQSGETSQKIIISPKECPVSVEREIG